ncbi:hypothetical protein J0A68_19970 [Algoriphagus sp. H41]|uniref:ABC transporter ATPase n=1 Tax=Algoriphagus oliviformis TaxID=2811231 RepID=A0ABS3C8D2_9BACT|nr:hypothetical protein [Algoriphagus oliviformis]MBN7813242.1 hypothetical protein [Algoriphagus oliviformis]
MYLPFEKMPDHSRVWVYQADKKISESDAQLVRDRLASFCEGWNTHGNLMPTSFEIFEDQILVLAVDESHLGASGCSIDSSVRTLRELENVLGTNLTDQGKITLKRSGGEVKVIPALGVKSRVASGEIDLETAVINPTVRVKADLKNLWRPVRNSWLGRYFPN